MASAMIGKAGRDQYFGCTRLATCPIIGIMTSIARPPGIIARPDSIAV